MFDWGEADRRRREKVQRQVFKTETAPPPKENPAWIYAAVGVGVILMVLVVLFVSGALS
jgi:hypothetical protein